MRFVYRRHGWVPVLVRQKQRPGAIPDHKMERKEEKDHDDDDVKNKGDHGDGQGSGGEIRQESGVVSMQVLPWYVRTTALGVLSVSAIMVRKTAVPAAAMAVVMVVGSLQRRWLGGVMCMKRFISSGISYFSQLFQHWNKTPDVERGLPAVEVRNPNVERGVPLGLPGLEIQQPLASPEHKMKINKRVPRDGPLLCLSAPCSPRQRGQTNTPFSAPLKGLEISTELESKVSLHRKSHEISTQLENKVTVPTKSQEINAQLEKRISMPRKSHEINAQLESKMGIEKNKGKMGNDEKKSKKFGRILSLDSQLMNPTRLEKAESFVRKRKGGRKVIDATIGASVMIVILFFLIAYGRISAIFFTSAWWYVLPNLKTDNSNKRRD